MVEVILSVATTTVVEASTPVLMMVGSGLPVEIASLPETVPFPRTVGLMPMVPLTVKVGKSVHVVSAATGTVPLGAGTTAVTTTVAVLGSSVWSWPLLVNGTIKAVVTKVLTKVTEGPGVCPTQTVVPECTE